MSVHKYLDTMLEGNELADEYQITSIGNGHNVLAKMNRNYVAPIYLSRPDAEKKLKALGKGWEILDLKDKDGGVYIKKTSINESASENPTTKLNDKTIVLAGKDGYAVKYSNNTQAKRKAESLGDGWTVYQPYASRVFYVKKTSVNESNETVGDDNETYYVVKAKFGDRKDATLSKAMSKSEAEEFAADLKSKKYLLITNIRVDLADKGREIWPGTKA